MGIVVRIGHFVVIGALSRLSVSYTHLDVYKRQIIVGGGLFGVLGMILGIPVFAVIYALAREFINARLKQKGLSTPVSYTHL